MVRGEECGTFQIRKLGPDDAELYWDLRLEALEREPLAFGKAAEEHRGTTLEETAARLRGVGEETFILGGFMQSGFDQGELVGTVMFSRCSSLKERHKGYVYGVYVGRSHRGKGLGFALMRELISLASTLAGLEQILLCVSAVQESAVRLYLRLGFETYGTEPRALKIGGEYVDEVLMVLRREKLRAE